MGSVTPPTAVIYCRVSDKKQKNDGDGLQSQEHRCRDYAAQRGYFVAQVFRDDASGAGDFMQRPGLVAMLRFLDRRRSGCIVIFDDLKRFARDTAFHLKLRQELAARHAHVECLNFRFEESPEGQFVETILAAQGQLERLQNRRQTLQKMRARLERGYYVFAAPIGYRYEKSKTHGRTLVRDEPVATLVQEALEGFASERFERQADVRSWLEAQIHFPKDANGRIRNQEIKRLLSRVTYAGYVGAPEWGVALREGHHDALISYETYCAIQDRLRGKSQGIVRFNRNEDFVLRGAVVCATCGSSLTASWAEGKYAVYAYYYCVRRGCANRSKTIPRAKIEDDFAVLLAGITCDRAVISVARAVFDDHWHMRTARCEDEVDRSSATLAQLDQHLIEVLDRITKALEPSMIRIFERRIRAIERRKNLVREQLSRQMNNEQTRKIAIASMLRFLAEPAGLWNSCDFGIKRAVLKHTLANRLTYVRGEGFGTYAVRAPFIKVMSGAART